MFVRFRETARRLQASLTETRRLGGKVRHEHVAGLGSVPLSPSASDRIAFWTKLHQRLEALSNRVDAAQRGAILTAIHTRIPMPTLDDQQAEQLERAQADARFWQSLADGYAEQVEGNKKLLATAQKAIAEREPLAPSSRVRDMKKRACYTTGLMAQTEPTTDVLQARNPVDAILRRAREKLYDRKHFKLAYKADAGDVEAGYIMGRYHLGDGPNISHGNGLHFLQKPARAGHHEACLLAVLTLLDGCNSESSSFSSWCSVLQCRLRDFPIEQWFVDEAAEEGNAIRVVVCLDQMFRGDAGAALSAYASLVNYALSLIRLG